MMLMMNLLQVDWGEDGVAECSEAPGPPCSVVRGDQSDTAFLAQFIARTGGNYSVVIDDGSHLPSHQVIIIIIYIIIIYHTSSSPWRRSGPASPRVASTLSRTGMNILL